MTAYIYGRVSTEEQDANPQVEPCRTLAVSRGHTIADNHIFLDKGVSGKIPFRDRPAGGVLARNLVRGDTLYIHKLDRAFRNIKDFVWQVDEWSGLGVCLVVIQFGGIQLDMSSHLGAFLANILAAVAQLERHFIVDRITEGVRRARKGGVWMGDAPIGFKNVYAGKSDRKQGRFVMRMVPNQEERELLNKMKEWYLAGYSLDQIRQHLEYKLKVKNPRNKINGAWSRQSVSNWVKASINLEARDYQCQRREQLRLTRRTTGQSP